MLLKPERASIAAQLRVTADWRGIAAKAQCSMATIYRIATAAGIPVPRGSGQKSGRHGNNKGHWDHEGTPFVIPRPVHPLAKLIVVESADRPLPRPYAGRSLRFLDFDEPAGNWRGRSIAWPTIS